MIVDGLLLVFVVDKSRLQGTKVSLQLTGGRGLENIPKSFTLQRRGCRRQYKIWKNKLFVCIQYAESV